MSYPHMQHICNLIKAGDVLFVGSTGHSVRHLIHGIAKLGIEGATIRRSKGSERVTLANGNVLHFATLRTLNKARGLSVWQIVLDDHTVLDNEAVRQELRACFHHPLIGSHERYTVIG